MNTVFVDGQEGTTGLQIRERLASHGGVRVLEIEPDRRKDAARRGELINDADVVFLCLPDAAAREAVAMIEPSNTRTRVIDASTAHRVADGWTFGLPELSREQRAAVRERCVRRSPPAHPLRGPEDHDEPIPEIRRGVSRST